MKQISYITCNINIVAIQLSFSSLVKKKPTLTLVLGKLPPGRLLLGRLTQTLTLIATQGGIYWGGNLPGAIFLSPLTLFKTGNEKSRRGLPHFLPMFT